jgi:hypothetical protein
VSFPAARPHEDAALKDAAAYVAAIRAAFLEEAHRRARDLAVEGHQHFPDDPELARYAYVLTPRGVVNAHLPPDPSVELDIQWLREHIDEYRGQWIALKDGQLVAHAATFNEFKAQLPKVEGLLVTRVAELREEPPLEGAADYVAAIRAAFLEEAHLRARELATEGHQRFPDDPELARYAYVLAPPKVVNAHLPPDPSVELDIRWLREHVDEYRGQWIALKNGKLVAHAPSVRELKEMLPSLKGLFLTGIAP